MKVTNLATVVRKKDKDQVKYVYDSCYKPETLNNIEDFGKMVVMSGTARRKPLNSPEIQEPVSEIEDILNLNLECDDFFKLRAPKGAMRSKNFCSEDKLMTRSCESLFECIKPYKGVTLETTALWESEQMKRSILKTDEFIYEKKAMRKVQFLSIDENDPITSLNEVPPFNFIHHNNQETNLDFEDPIAEAQQLQDILSPNSKKRKTISSQDFLNDAFFGNTE